MMATVPSEFSPGVVDDGTCRLPELCPQIALGVAVGNKADVVGVGLAGNLEPEGLGLRTHLGLGGVGQWEQRTAQLFLVQHAEHVGLILVGVGGTMQFQFRPVVHHPGIVARRDSVKTERDSSLEYSRELDPLVASQAGVRGAASAVLSDEVIDDLLLELLREVPHVERDVQQVGGAPGVMGVLQGTTATRPLPVGLRVAVQRQVHPGHVMSRGHETRGCDRRVDPP